MRCLEVFKDGYHKIWIDQEGLISAWSEEMVENAELGNTVSND